MTKLEDRLVDSIWRAEQIRKTGGSDPGPKGSSDAGLEFVIFCFFLLIILGYFTN